MNKFLKFNELFAIQDAALLFICIMVRCLSVFQFYLIFMYEYDLMKYENQFY